MVVGVEQPVLIAVPPQVPNGQREVRVVDRLCVCVCVRVCVCVCVCALA